MLYIRFKTVETGKRQTKYGRWLRIFGVKTKNFPKNGHSKIWLFLSSGLPKLGARSPSMIATKVMWDGKLQQSPVIGQPRQLRD